MREIIDVSIAKKRTTEVFNVNIWKRPPQKNGEFR